MTSLGNVEAAKVDLAAHSERSHARLSPSAAHRWLECPGSIKASEGIPEKTSRFADEGTAAHTLADMCFTNKIDPAKRIHDWVDVATGQLIGRVAARAQLDKDPDARVHEVTEEMADAVQVYLDLLNEIAEGATVETETKLDLSHIEGMDFGTGDFSAFGGGTLDIVDFKYGKGVVVQVKRNPQLMTYASGVMRSYATCGIKNIRLWVVQPRAPHPEGPVRSWVFDVLDLMEFEEDLRDGAALALSEDAKRKAGEHCKFCPAAATCPENKGKALAVAHDVFGEMMDEPARMSSEQLADVLAQAHYLKNWLRAVEEFAHSEALEGRLPTGFKLVPKRASRRWLSTDELWKIANGLGLSVNDLWAEPELKSPAQLEPIVAGKNKKERAAALAPFVKQVSTGTNLVPLSDARAPARPLLEDIFE